jgi:hypothetical protein
MTMALPTQNQIYTALRYAGTAVGTIGSIAALASVMSADQAATFVADLRAIVTDLTQLFGDTVKFALFIIPIATLWLAKIGWNSASPVKQAAAVQAAPTTQVLTTDPKLAQAVPGVKLVDKLP